MTDMHQTFGSARLTGEDIAQRVRANVRRAQARRDRLSAQSAAFPAVPAQMPTAPPKVLRMWRISLGLTQAQVAVALGVAVPRVCEWETGAVTPRQRNLDRWVEVLRRADDDRK